ncbi:CaiF/GrlA family transcriptional regulator [Salmonella enterica]|nr:CaiF/GrlA family transcriptional regulator [Salmonella enterica]
MCSDNTHEKKPNITAGNDIHYPAQTNHDACFIPESVRQYASEPLYIIVAHWCQQQQDWVQRNQISEAFHITARRASYLVAYLRNKTNRVDCECRRSVLVNKVVRYEIRITDIKDSLTVKKERRSSSPPRSRRRRENAGKDQTIKLWNQLCLERKAGLLLKKK